MTDEGLMSLRAVWDTVADRWIDWARAPGLDSYWRFHRQAFLAIVPEPSRRTLDLGCGEGRVTRDLVAAGHNVVAIDGSARMVAAARAAAPDIEYHVSDAAALPLDDCCIDLVVAFMSLQDVDDLRGAVRECARVLRPKGQICVAVVHPLNSAGSFVSEAPDSAFVIDGSYLAERRYREDLSREGHTMTFHSHHRTIDRYVSELAAAGFVIDLLREHGLPRAAIDEPRRERWARIPMFLHLRAVLAPQI